jgi:hypothetical protein
LLVAQGQWVQNVRQGSGTHTLANNRGSYLGTFHHDCYHGSGTLITNGGGVDGQDDTQYDGGFVNDSFHGQGRLTNRQTGQVFVGTFVSGQMHGPGQLLNVYKPAHIFSKYLHSNVVNSLESTCVGEWENGVFVQGQAQNVCIDALGTWGSALKQSLEASNSSGAAGMYVDSEYWAKVSTLSVTQLFPEAVLPTGAVSSSGSSGRLLGLYSGQMSKRGPEDSMGRCMYADGSEFEGVFKTGRRNGVGHCVSVNKDEFEGKYVGNIRRGTLLCVYVPRGIVHKHNFAGQGIWRSVHGDSYDGQWDDDKPHGYGIRYYQVMKTYLPCVPRVGRMLSSFGSLQDGSSVAGIWDHGVLVSADN